MRILVVCVLLFSISVTTMAQSSAVVTATGAASINGKPAGQSTALASGDRITTGSDSTANLTLNGATAKFSANSAGTYDGSSIALEAGKVSVTASNTFAVRAGNVTVTPQGRSRFEVSREGGNVTVAVREGSVTLPDNTTVAAGKTVTRNDGSASAGAVPPAKPAAGSAGVSTGAVVGAAAVGAAAATGAAVSVRKPASPSRP